MPYKALLKELYGVGEDKTQRNVMADQILNSVKNTAKRLDLSYWTIVAWIRQGRIESVKLGGRRLVPESAILKLASEGLPQNQSNVA
jgi:excisionase family DNA binding protein